MFNRFTKREKILMVMLTLVICLYLPVRLFFVPQVTAYRRTVKDLDQARDKMDYYREISSCLEKETSQLKTARRQLHNINDIFRPDGGEGEALTHLGRVAENTGVVITLYRPGAAVVRQFYVVRPANLAVRGYFSNVINFLRRLEKAGAILGLSQIRRLSIRPVTAESGTMHAEETQVLAEVEMVSYYLNPGKTAMIREPAGDESTAGRYFAAFSKPQPEKSPRKKVKSPAGKG